jgi:hypothetical protein
MEGDGADTQEKTYHVKNLRLYKGERDSAGRPILSKPPNPNRKILNPQATITVQVQEAQKTQATETKSTPSVMTERVQAKPPQDNDEESSKREDKPKPIKRQAHQEAQDDEEQRGAALRAEVNTGQSKKRRRQEGQVDSTRVPLQAKPTRSVSEVEEILQQRHRTDGRREFLVRWQQHTSNMDEWLLQDFFFENGAYSEILTRFLRTRRNRRPYSNDRASHAMSMNK